MWTIAPRTNTACHSRRACVYCLHECLVCAMVVFRPLAPGTRRHRPCYMARTARPHRCLQCLSPGLEPPGCRSGTKSTFLVGRVELLSLDQIQGARVPYTSACSIRCLQRSTSTPHLESTARPALGSACPGVDYHDHPVESSARNASAEDAVPTPA